MSKDIIYQMLPRLWGEGSMASVDDATLSYLKGLGITHLWCTGIIRHSTGQPFVKGDAGSPYAISDYYDVNPYLATVPSRRISEFRSLVSRVHKYGLKFIIDFVPNHVGCDYTDKHGGIPLCDWHDYDWSDTIKIDYNAPGTWEAMYRIVRFWASKGVDGFRCDMVELVPPEFLKWLIAKIKEEFPEVVFIAEVYQKEKYRMYIEDVRFDFLYDKSGLYDVLRSITAGHGTARAITWNWQFLQDLQPNMLNFLENHDEQRFASPCFAGDARKAFPALAAGALFNGASFMIYAGQEVGADAAEGAEGRTSIFNWTSPVQLEHLHRYVRSDRGLNTEEAGMLAGYRRLLGLLALPRFRDGEVYDLCWCNSILLGFDPEKHFTFLRYKRLPRKRKADATLVVCNFSSETADMRINLPEDLRSKKELSWLPSRVDACVPAWDYSSLHL